MQEKVRKSADIEIVAGAPTDPDAFLDWLDTIDPYDREMYRYEQSRGVVTRMQAMVSRHHSRITRNLVVALAGQLDLDDYDISSGEFGMRTPFGNRMPDVVVDRIEATAHRRVSTRPIVVIEVLSPSTMHIDFQEKLPEYMAIASVTDILVCSQDEPRVWLFARQSEGAWPARSQMIVGRSEGVPLAGLDVELTMASLYRGIPDPPAG